MDEKLLNGMPYEAILEAPPTGCARCGSPVEELPEFEKVASNFPPGNKFHGKIPYICKHITCGKVVYGPSRLSLVKKNVPAPRSCCF